MFQVQKRNSGDTKPKQLRKRGLVPMALVGRSHEVMPIQATNGDLRSALTTLDSHGRFDFQIEGEKKKRSAIVKNIEQDPLRRELIHVTIQEVADDDTIKVDVPVIMTGHSTASEETGVNVQLITDHLKLKGRVADMPDKIEVDISNLALGEHISASDIALPEGVTLISAHDAVLATVTVSRQAVSDAAEESAEAEETPEEAGENE